MEMAEDMATKSREQTLRVEGSGNSVSLVLSVFRGLRNCLNMDWPQHHSIDRLKARGVEKIRGTV